MTEAPFRTGLVLPGEVFRGLLPLDGRPNDDRRGVRLYAYRKRWWVTLFHTEFGETVVAHWGPLGDPDEDQPGDVDRRHDDEGVPSESLGISSETD